MNRIAFTLPDVGMREVKGMAYIDEEAFLVLRVEHSLFGAFDTKTEILRIEPGVLKEVHIKRGLFKDRLVLRPRSAELLDAVPGEHVATIELRVPRKHRQELEDLVASFHRIR